MNLLEKNIPYKSIIMRCDSINGEAYSEVSEFFSIEKYHDGMKTIWADIQKMSGQFDGVSDDDIITYFEKTFLNDNNEIEDRCFFLKDLVEGKYIGTCCAWFSNKEDKEVPVLHWLAVLPSYRNKGCARILITQVMQYFERKYEKQSIYLHTQPESYQAIKLYNDFGFNMTKKDCYGHAINEYEAAIDVLREVMSAEEFKKLIDSTVE